MKLLCNMQKHSDKMLKVNENGSISLTMKRNIMEKELTEVYCGNAKGKTTLAMGQSLKASTQGKSVIVIQFLKGKERRALDFLQDLEDLDIKIFRFEKQDICYEELNEQEKSEERSKGRNRRRRGRGC